MKAMLLLLVLLNPVELTATDRVSFIERNTFYDGEGRIVFTQHIFIDWCEASECERVVAWRLVKDCAQAPEFNHATGKYEVRWNDGDVLRRVLADGIRESHTMYDPEMEARSEWPKDRRAELRRVRP